MPTMLPPITSDACSAAKTVIAAGAAATVMAASKVPNYDSHQLNESMDDMDSLILHAPSQSSYAQYEGAADSSNSAFFYSADPLSQNSFLASHFETPDNEHTLDFDTEPPPYGDALFAPKLQIAPEGVHTLDDETPPPHRNTFLGPLSPDSESGSVSSSASKAGIERRIDQQREAKGRAQVVTSGGVGLPAVADKRNDTAGGGLSVQVTGHKKIQEPGGLLFTGSSSYVVYVIETKAGAGADFPVPRAVVQRRFREFVALGDRWVCASRQRRIGAHACWS